MATTGTRRPIDASELVRVGTEAGLSRVGICAARPWTSARTRLERRRETGLSDKMAFTHRNPARSSDPSRIVPGASSMVVGAWSYRSDVPAPPPGTQARVARYAAVDHYSALRTALGDVASTLRSHGWRAVVVCDDNSVVDREAAWRAGIGWYGKNSMILVPGEGSWFVLGAVVTDAALASTTPPVSDGCGPCRRCLDGCPTGAIVAPGVVDARRCLSWLLQRPGDFPEEHRVALGNRIYGCDDCQEVCPPNRRSSEPAPLAESTWLDVCDLLALSDDELLERCGAWYIPDRDAKVVRRNLLIVFGNTAPPNDHRADAALADAAAHPDPMIVRHARWARRRLADRKRSDETAGS